MITLSIDTTKVDRDKIAKGKYLNLVLIETPNGKYGDFMVKQDSTKEEREARVQTPILGNAKYLRKKEPFSAKPQQSEAEKAFTQPDDDEIPF